MKQWSKECSHYTKEDIISYSMKQLLSVTNQPNSDDKEGTHKSETPGGEVTQQDTMKKTVQSNNSNGGLVCTGRGFLGSQDRAAEEVESVRELRTSTVAQKPAMYASPKSTTKYNEYCGNDASESGEHCDSSAVMVEVGSTSNATEPLPWNLDNGHVIVPSSLSTKDTSHKLSPSPQAVNNEDLVSVTPKVNRCTDGCRLEQILSNSQKPSTEPAEEDLVTLISEDEFGVSEVPVFATAANSLPHLPARFLPQLSVVTNLATAKLQGMGCDSDEVIRKPPSFSPSAQSAFKPVAGACNMPSPVKVNHHGVNAMGSTPGLARPMVAELPECPGLSGQEPVPQGVTEDLLKGDPTNWFCSMKLFDHLEAVYGNVNAWLDQIDSKLAGENEVEVDAGNCTMLNVLVEVKVCALSLQMV